MTLAAVDLDRLQQATIDAWEVVIAIVVLIAAWIASRLTRRWIRRLANHLKGLNDEAKDLAARLGGYSVLFIGIGIALSVLGAPIQPVLAAAVIFGVVLALSLRGIADNFASGIVIQTRGTIHLNDEISALGYQGQVRELNGRAVVIETYDGAMVHLPNARILSNPVANLTESGARRSEVELRTKSRPLTDMVEGLLATVRESPGVRPDQAPEARLVSSEPAGVVARLSFWHSPSDGEVVLSRVLIGLGERFPDIEVRAIPTSSPQSAPAPQPAPV